MTSVATKVPLTSGAPTNSRTSPSYLLLGSEGTEREELAMQLMGGWIWETDAEHRFCYMSKSVELFSGKPRAWHYGKTRQEVGLVDFDQPRWRQYRDQLNARAPFGPIEFVRIENGRSFWMRTVGRPQFDADGSFLGYRGVGFDITSEMRSREAKSTAEAELAERQQELEHAKTGLERQVGQLNAARERIEALASVKASLILALTNDVATPLQDAISELRALQSGSLPDDAQSTVAATVERCSSAVSALKQMHAAANLK